MISEVVCLFTSIVLWRWLTAAKKNPHLLDTESMESKHWLLQVARLSRHIFEETI